MCAYRLTAENIFIPCVRRIIYKYDSPINTAFRCRIKDMRTLLKTCLLIRGMQIFGIEKYYLSVLCARQPLIEN